MMNRNQRYGNSSNVSSQQPDVQLLMEQVRHLQEKVGELSQNQSGSASQSAQNSDENTRILLVSNLPPTLATCDAIFFMFDRFGVVERIKILHNKRSAALVQMQTPDGAQLAVQDQYVLKRTGADIYVNFSNKVPFVRMPSEMGIQEDGLSKDFTMPPQEVQTYYPANSYVDMNQFQGEMSGSGNPYNGHCFLVSNFPTEQLGNPDALCNLFGYYGDVHKVKILRNKPDCALIQMAKPHQVFTIRQNLDQLKLYGKKICVSFSRVESIKMPRDIGHDDDEGTKDFTNVRGVHRFRNPMVATKLSKNLCAPTSLLHVANLPDTIKSEDLKTYITDHGFTVTSIDECGKDGSMALVQMASVEEAVMALAKLHNITPKGHATKNNSGLCFSFSKKPQKDRQN